MRDSTITINVKLDEQKMPQQIEWNATESTAETMQQAKGMMLSLWDGFDKSALRIDLWTKEMRMDEMADFFYQTLNAMADTFERATRKTDLKNDLKQFAKSFYEKYKNLESET